MRKILVVNDFPIFPLSHGGKVRLFNIYKNLSKEFDITYISLGDTKKIEEETITEHFKVVIIPKKIIFKIINIGAEKILRYPVGDFVELFFAPFNSLFKKTINVRIHENDIIIFSHPYLYPAVIPFIPNNKIVVYEALNVEFILKKSIFNKGIIRTILLNRLKQTEGNLLKRCNLCFSMSEFDKRQLAQIYKVNSSKIFISPNGVDSDEYNDLFPRNNKRTKEKLYHLPSILFLGSGHPPNITAAQQIIDNIAPKSPNELFIIAGNVSLKLKDRYKSENITLVNYIPDDKKKELFKAIDAAINPMLSGSGTNLKMLDYMAAGIPVISTPIGARGIEIEENHHAIICDISEFPYQISRLLNDNKLYEQLSTSGRKLVKEKYDWKIISWDMSKRLNNLAVFPE